MLLISKAMKINDIFIYSLVLVSLASCQKEIPYDFNAAGNKVVMNAQIHTNEDIHAVYLSISTSLSIQKIKSGSVTCYINGNMAAEAQLDTSKDDDDFIRDEALYGYHAVGSAPSRTRQTRFVFKANFKPGDKVRLECTANGGEYSAYSEVIVPRPPVFHAVDTSRYYNSDENSNSYNRWVYRIRIKGNDIAGERNYFRLTSEYDKTLHVEYMDGEDEPEDDESYEEGPLRIDRGKDPILLDGATETDMDISGASENYYNAFSDYLFRDGTYDFTYQVRESEFLSDNGYDTASKRVNLTARVYPTLWGITEAEYNFLKALSLYLYNGDDITFTGPISIPTNVEGGLGVVSIATPSRDTVVFNRTLYKNPNL